MTILERTRALARELPAHRAAHDAARQLEPAVVAALRDVGVLGCLLPRELGGVELAPAAYAEVLEVLATGDSATAWCAMTAATSSIVAAYLPRATAAQLWSSPEVFLAGVFAPGGALAADGRLAGRWSYGSGCRHAELFALGALAGRRHVVCFVRPDQVRIADNWDTLGLAGTGSHDLVVEAAAIAPEHVTSVFDHAPWSDAPLYRVPLFGLLAVGIAACGLGIARGALAHAASRLDDKASSAGLAHYASLTAELAAARAYLHATCTATYANASTGAVSAADRGELRLAACHVAARCADVVRGAFHLVGGAAVRAGHPVQAAVRDIETLLTHKMVADRVLPAAGRALLAIGTPPPDL